VTLNIPLVLSAILDEYELLLEASLSLDHSAILRAHGKQTQANHAQGKGDCQIRR